MRQSDAELVQEILDGNKQAFALLVARYERPVRAVAISIVKSSHTADDIAQEAFVRAWEQLPKLRNPKVFGPWMMKIARRRAIDSLRRQQSLNYSDSLDQMAAHERNGRLDEKKTPAGDDSTIAQGRTAGRHASLFRPAFGAGSSRYRRPQRRNRDKTAFTGT